MLGESLHLTLEYLALEAKVESARSYGTTLEAENSKLKKELIVAMNKANLVKEKLKTLTEELRVERELTMEKDKQLAATKEALLFSWYFKGFELLRRYFIKHPSAVDSEKLDLEEVDKELAVDKAAQSSAIETDALENAPATNGIAVDA